MHNIIQFFHCAPPFIHQLSYLAQSLKPISNLSCFWLFTIFSVRHSKYRSNTDPMAEAASWRPSCEGPKQDSCCLWLCFWGQLWSLTMFLRLGIIHKWRHTNLGFYWCPPHSVTRFALCASPTKNPTPLFCVKSLMNVPF